METNKNIAFTNQEITELYSNMLDRAKSLKRKIFDIIKE